MKISFIGFGLIGGSIARALKKNDPDTEIYAYQRHQQDLWKALSDGVVTALLETPYSEKLRESDIIFLAAPAEQNIIYLSDLHEKGLIKEDALVTDVSSTKNAICRKAKELGIRNFCGGHPMAGSEKTGYENSSDFLFNNAYYIITPVFEGEFAEKNTDRMKKIAEILHAVPIILDPDIHDISVAAVSHLPHIAASTLVNAVRLSDDKDFTMRRLAAGGFRDITRIASSSPVMWDQILRTNSEKIIKMLDLYIDMLDEISSELKEKRNSALIRDSFREAGEYRSGMDIKLMGSVMPEYSFSVDVADEIGAISTMSVILASKGISIKNIGVNNARDHGEGALRVTFYDEDSEEKAKDVLKKYQYDIRG